MQSRAQPFGFHPLPRFSAQGYDPGGKPLTFIPLQGPVRPMRMGLLMPTDAARANVIRAFTGYCREQYDMSRRQFPHLLI